MQTILLVRHGYPLCWDQKLKTRGSPAHLRIDPTLAEIGVAQARHCAATIAADGGAAAVLSSPFRACLETADLIAAACSAEITADWRLGEVLLSQVLGSPFSPGSAMDPEWAERRAGAGKPAHPESDRTIAERVMKTVLGLRDRKPFASRIVIVSHAIILTELVKTLTGRMATGDWHPGAITTLTRAKPIERQWRLRGGFAEVAHLGADDRAEPVEQIEHRYHPLDSRS